MTRQKVVEEFRVEDGFIRSPGKFEGERPYVPFYYELFLDGCSDGDGDDDSILFTVSEEDMVEFPELAKDGYKDSDTLRLCVRDDGFVCLR